MLRRIATQSALVLAAVTGAQAVQAQSLAVQCPRVTTMHPTAQSLTNTNQLRVDTAHPGFIKCQEIAGTDGFATMADGNQLYTFGFGALSGIKDILLGQAGTQPETVFNSTYTGPVAYSDVASSQAAVTTTSWTNVNDVLPNNGNNRRVTSSANAGVIEPAMMMNLGTLGAMMPAPEIAVDEDDELFLTLSNTGQIMRPDLFEQHTVHWHGYPNASSYFDGVPDASVSINIAGSFTYYYRVNDAGTYFWHCHITPPEHLQMGMVGQLFVRPRQNRVVAGTSLSSALVTNNAKAPKVPGWTSTNNPSASNGCSDILCTGQTPVPATTAAVNAVAGGKYAYNDGDASTRYDVEYPIQIMGFDPNFHFVGMTFNPEPFVDMKDKYYVLNGRGYPDTVGGDAGTAGVLSAEGSDAVRRASQPLPSVINIPAGKKALLRLSNLSVTEYSTLGTIGIPMHVIGVHARLLRDTAGGDMSYYTNSVTMGGGESMDVMLDATDTTAYPAGSVFFLYSKNLDHLSNDAENFGGQMTEIRIN